MSRTATLILCIVCFVASFAITYGIASCDDANAYDLAQPAQLPPVEIVEGYGVGYTSPGMPISLSAEHRQRAPHLPPRTRPSRGLPDSRERPVPLPLPRVDR